MVLNNSDKLFSSGEFAKKTHITKKTLRYYAEHNILEPTFVAENGNRYYGDEAFIKLQQILLLKYLGFSLADIKELTLNNSDFSQLSESLKIQRQLIGDRIEQLKLVQTTLTETIDSLDNYKSVDWNNILTKTNVLSLEQSLKNQYLNSSNISARINLHTRFSSNALGWFPWVFETLGLRKGDRVLELGCGDGSLWLQNVDKVLDEVFVVLSDISDGIVREVRSRLSAIESAGEFDFRIIDCNYIPFDEDSFDVVIANHLLFYCDNIHRALQEARRVMVPGGRFVASTYGAGHMQEITTLVQKFDDRIQLSAQKLFDSFGKDNGAEILARHFDSVRWVQYEDSLMVTDADALISYILSCHGNQNQYIVDNFNEFKNFVRSEVKDGFKITKEAGVFVCGIV